MRNVQCGLAMALCLSACACGPHGTRGGDAAASQPARPVVDADAKPQKWEITAGARWARPGMWSMVAEGPSKVPVDVVANDALGGRVVRLDHDGGYDVWQARISCEAGTAVVSEGLHIDPSGRHLQSLPTSVVKLDGAPVASFCASRDMIPGGLAVADRVLKRPAASFFARSAGVVAPTPPRPPRIDAEAIRRMQNERRDAMTGTR